MPKPTGVGKSSQVKFTFGEIVFLSPPPPPDFNVGLCMALERLPRPPVSQRKFASGQTKNHKSTLKSGGRGGNVSHIVLLSTCQGAHDAFHFHLRTCFWHLCANAFFFKHFWGNFTMMPKAREAERAREAEGPKGQRSEGSKDPRGRPKRPRARNAERARRARGVQRPEGSKGPRGRRAQEAEGPEGSKGPSPLWSFSSS